MSPASRECSLHVKVDGQHIMESPFEVHVQSPVERLGTPILKINKLKKSMCVAMNHKGEMVVADGESLYLVQGERESEHLSYTLTLYGIAMDSN